jgi:uncharacterized protein
MKIIIFGATGMVGKELVKQALFNGDQVKAYGRNVFTEGLPEDDQLELVQGALFDEGQVLKAIKGCDAVVSALGGAFDGNDKTRSLGMKNIALQMKKAGVKRIVAIGGLGVLNADTDHLLMEEEHFPPEYLAVSHEHLKALKHLQETDLEWTFVCPPNIINHGPTGSFTTNANYVPEVNNNAINAGDLALFMLKAIATNDYLRQKVGISN